MERKIEIVSMELIRPTSPTPDHLRSFEFSYLDQMAIPIFAPLALFYPPPSSHSICVDESYSYEQARAVNSSRLLLLKKSLSETLARFYPFAGRIKNNSIECNDDGVPFYEAFAHNYQFDEIHRNFDVTKHFLPSVEGGSVLHYSCYPLLVQVTLFKCGGMAIGICAFHKVADGATLCTLASAWAITTRDSPDCVLLPELVAAAKFLPPPIPYVSNGPKSLFEFTKFFYNEQRVTKLFAFDAPNIAALKAKANSDDVQFPTRIEVVSAVIWKSAMAAAGTERRSSKLAHLVNIRKRFVPPFPNHCVGNAVAVVMACKAENDGSDLPTLVTLIRKSLSELSAKYVDKQSTRDEAILAIPYDLDELPEAHFQGEIAMQISSVCGYQFYDVDFGWGKPSWLSVSQTAMRNQVILMDSRDSGGIDAFVCLKDENSLSAFEHELQLLAFGSA